MLSEITRIQIIVKTMTYIYGMELKYEEKKRSYKYL